MDTNKAMMEVEAIDAVRNELKEAVMSNKDSITLSEIHSRLISLYASLDVHNIESIIHRIRYGKVA